MQIPTWLLNSTSAAKFAAPGAAPGWGDVAQGIGHSMLDHYRGTLDPVAYPKSAPAGAPAGGGFMPQAALPPPMAPLPPEITPIMPQHAPIGAGQPPMGAWTPTAAQLLKALGGF